MNAVGVILAGGLARRLGGGDKALTELGGRPLLSHAIDRLSPQVDRIVINANGDPSRFEAFGLPVVADTVEGFAGPLAGVLAGMEWAKSRNCHWIVTVATDAPFFPEDLVARLFEAVSDDSADLACVESNGRAHPVFGIWPVRLVDDLRHALVVEDIRKVDVWTGKHRLSRVAFPAPVVDPFFNINRPEDVAEAARIMGDQKKCD